MYVQWHYESIFLSMFASVYDRILISVLSLEHSWEARQREDFEITAQTWQKES